MQLIKDFPVLMEIMQEKRWKKRYSGGNKWCLPKMDVRVQAADPDTMYLKAKNIGLLDRCYVPKENGDRGIRIEHLIAVDHTDEAIARLRWSRYPEEKQNQVAKDIFLKARPEDVNYLVWVTYLKWFKPASKEEENSGILFDTTQPQGVDLEIIIFCKPKNKSFTELIEIAKRKKKESEEAYKYFPKKQPAYPGIHKALREGHKMHAFVSGGGLRVVRIDSSKNMLIAYGEHPNIEKALNHLEEDCLAGGRPYDEMYGKLHPHYLTGSLLATSNIDCWILNGNKFDCWQENDVVVFALAGYAQTEVPEEVEERLLELEEGEAVSWANRGYRYVSYKDRFVNGELNTTSKIVESPPGKNASDPWMYYITKTGRGKNFWEAMRNAFAAREIESNE
jgi:hypothetical protein